MPSSVKTVKSSIAIPSRINDLTVLPVQLAPSTAYAHPATHYFYIRPDTPKDAAEISSENQRSLFVANIPITGSESQFRGLFKALAPAALVDRVHFSSEEKRGSRLAVTGDVIVQGTKVGVPIGVLRGKKRKRAGGAREDDLVSRKLEEMEVPNTWGRGVWESGSSAIIVFVDKDAMGAAWKAVQKAVKEQRRIAWPNETEGLGMDRYRTHNSLTYPSPTMLQAKVNAFLTHFATLESLRNKQLARQRNVPDEEGFVTVTRGGRTGAGRVEDAQAAQARLKERAEKRIGSDFYRFQTREQAKKREGELKRKFEDDRRKVSEMRKRRGRVVPESG